MQHGPAGNGPAPAPVVVTPADRRYPDLVRGWNQRYVSAPEAVHLVRTGAQAADVVRRAVREGKRLTVRSGGHCWEEFTFHPDVDVVLDMSLMNQVHYDPRHRAFGVEPGAQLLGVYEALYRTWGVTVPGGTCYQVGAGGHVSGGGWGMLCRRDGLIIDHLYAVEVVVVGADGSVREVFASRARHDPHRDLWWAHTGGGGGNFGVVTRYWFRSPHADGADPAELLPRPPAEVLLSAVSWPWESLTEETFTRLVRNYGDWHARHRAPGSPEAAVCSLFSLNHVSNGAIGLVTQVDATVPHARELLDGFLRAVTDGVDVPHRPATTTLGEFAAMPDLAEPRRMPWLEATRYFGTANADANNPTQKGDFKSAYMKAGFPEDHLTALHQHLTRRDLGNPSASVMLSSFGGQVSAVGPAATAFPHRDAAFKAAWMIWWTDDSAEADSLAWIREFYHGMYAATGGVPVPDDVTDGCFLNYADIDLSDPAFNTSGVPWHTLYYKDNYARLQRVKQAYDPGDVFRHSQSVTLPGA
ncbi:FAD-binding oxidoreductase [Streptomyces niger]|uniref:FAD-binding oxidoreductase n=1 Tax=Streptomyces niger TaxID=66373 RepID=UPI00069A59AD|nr:FAD-binding oxidoreductase [Streptomyces niger]